jgi:hypothetical protein
MRVLTSKLPESTSSLSSRKIAEGKRKGESYREALSLQDVFSDSGNATGSSQKTSLPSDTERRKRTQLNKNQSKNQLEVVED